MALPGKMGAGPGGELQSSKCVKRWQGENKGEEGRGEQVGAGRMKKRELSSDSQAFSNTLSTGYQPVRPWWGEIQQSASTSDLKVQAVLWQ